MNLGTFGFTKSVTHCENKKIVEIPLVVPEVVTGKKLECYVCHERFCNNQGFPVHLNCRHGVLPKPSNVNKCINEKNQRKTVQSSSSTTKSTETMQSTKFTGTIQPAGSTSSK